MQKNKQNLCFVFGVLVMLSGRYLPAMFGLEKPAVNALMFTIAILFWLVTETLPIGIVALLMIVLQYPMGLTPSFAATVTNFSTPIFFFLIAAFGLSAAVREVPLSRRILKYLLRHFGKSTKGAITAILLSTALLSTVIANLPSLILFYGISLNFLTMFQDERERRQTGKSLCIGLIFASVIGGICTPVGNMCCMLGFEYMASSGSPISFLQWMLIAVPLAVILFPLMCFLLFKIFPPVEIGNERRQEFIDQIEIPEKYTMPEKWVMLIFGVMMICWLLGSAFPIFNTMHVTICGATLMLLPFFRIISWDSFSKAIGWPSILMTCGFVSLCAVFTSTGITDWILNRLDMILPDRSGTFLVLVILGVIIVLTLLLISNGPALITIFGLPVIGIAANLGIHPVYLMIPLAMFMCYSVLLPIDAISLVTYASDTYTMRDMLKAGSVFAAVSIFIVAVLCPLLARLWGF